MQTPTGGRFGARYPIAETLWIIAGTILLLAFGDVVIVLALAVGFVGMTAAWWIHRDARPRSGDEALASVSHLPADARDLTMASAHAPWHRRRAA
ncbi:hypothetical protein A5659_15310 [Mycobacterium sp. 1165196.3]|uniref:hypothetical protein n=1 Tax=unclassified Mycobacterium TaxID=2642494 RepID=UPI0007FEEB02|nr:MULTISPECIES: hypothetical protein [unclassified Mycobacterium]OBK38020.1 hypothetical protein A5659_15310 [Mycobacterium sp. 1165196.3]OBK91841.1 hypothetical protein A5646_03940 [Mycobacterium sp. 1245499.0]